MPRQVNETREFFYECPPMIGTNTTAVICLAAGTVQVTVDLTTIPGTPMRALNTIGSDDYNPNPTGHFLYLEAVGADIYVAFGPTLASLTGLSTSAVSTVSAAGAVTQVAGGTFCIPQGKAVRWRIPSSEGTPDNADVGASSPARFMGFLTATGTSGTLQVYQSSP